MLADRLGRACGVMLNHIDRIERQTEATRQALIEGEELGSEAVAIRAQIDARLGELVRR